MSISCNGSKHQGIFDRYLVDLRSLVDIMAIEGINLLWRALTLHSQSCPTDFVRVYVLLQHRRQLVAVQRQLVAVIPLQRAHQHPQLKLHNLTEVLEHLLLNRRPSNPLSHRATAQLLGPIRKLALIRYLLRWLPPLVLLQLEWKLRMTRVQVWQLQHLQETLALQSQRRQKMDLQQKVTLQCHQAWRTQPRSKKEQQQHQQQHHHQKQACPIRLQT